MSGLGYDMNTSIYTQEGKIMQLEYAQKGIQQAETVIGVVCSDGVIIASEKIRHSRLQSKNSDRRIFSVDSHVSVCICG